MATRTRKTTTKVVDSSEEEAPKVEEAVTENDKPKTVEELEASERYVKVSEFHRLSGLSSATIYNRLRGTGKNGRPTQKRLEGVQADNTSWWVDLEGASVKEALKEAENQTEGDSTKRKTRGATPAELREMVAELEEAQESLKARNDELEVELADTKSRVAELESELEQKRTDCDSLQEELDLNKRELDDTKTDLKVFKGKYEAIIEYSQKSQK